MSVLYFNCRGLGATQAVADLRGLLRRLALNLVFLLETKRSTSEMNAILRDLSNYVGVFIDARGRAGGLALLWDKTTNVQFLSSSLRHIDVTVQWDADSNAWCFSGIYDWPESQQKWKTR